MKNPAVNTENFYSVLEHQECSNVEMEMHVKKKLPKNTKKIKDTGKLRNGFNDEF